MINTKINIIKLNETNSTNEFAKSLLKENKQSLPFAIQSNFQSRGKGQVSKIWESDKDKNLLLSLVVKAPKIAIEQQFKISQAISLAIRKIISNYTPKACIKWPNDIYIHDNKIAGILIENTIVGQTIDKCIIGIGLNINQTLFSENVPNPTSLKLENNKDFNIDEIRDLIINEIISSLQDLKDIDYTYQNFLYRKGELEQFRRADSSSFYGVIIGTDKIGKLLIRTENNQINSFSNNEIHLIHRRLQEV